MTYLTNGKHPWSRALNEWKHKLVLSLGGWDYMSPEAHELLAQLTISKIILDSLGAYALTHRPINRQKNRLYQWVTERDKLVSSYVGLLRALRETVNHDQKKVPDLETYLEKKALDGKASQED